MLKVLKNNIKAPLDIYDIYREEHKEFYKSVDELETTYVEISGEIKSY